MLIKTLIYATSTVKGLIDLFKKSYIFTFDKSDNSHPVLEVKAQMILWHYKYILFQSTTGL